MVPYRARKICLGEYEFYMYSCYWYYVGDKSECVSAEECVTRIGEYAYYEQKICVLARPANDEDFMKVADYIWSCKYEIDGGRIDRVLLYAGDTAVCVSEAMCYFGWPNGVRSSFRGFFDKQWCISR